MELRHPRQAAQVAIALAMWAAIIVLSPVILLAGDPMNRYVRKHLRWRPPLAEVTIVRTGNRSARVMRPVRLTPVSSFLSIVISNALWIALTAPGRWVIDNFSTLP